MLLIFRDEVWTSNYALDKFRGRGLPYERIETTDNIQRKFATQCARLHIKCEWFPFAGAISFNPEHINIKRLDFLREEAIDLEDDNLVRAAHGRIREAQRVA